MATHPGLKDLLRYPLMSAFRERRTRRIARGVSVHSDTLSHTSTNQPAPLSPLEEAVIIVATGLTGPVMHDGPLRTPDGDSELGSPFYGYIRVCQLMKSANKAVPGRFRRLS